MVILMDIGKTNKINMNKDMIYTQKNLTPNKSSLEISKSKENRIDDIITISNEAKALLAQNENLFTDNEKIQELKEILRELKEASDKSSNPLDLFTKCIQIAIHIMNGDNVPIKDMHFLAENEPELYSSALLLRQQNDKPKRHDSLLEDEEEKNNIKVENKLKEFIPNEIL